MRRAGLGLLLGLIGSLILAPMLAASRGVIADETPPETPETTVVEAILAPYARQMAQWPPALQARLRARARLWAGLSPLEQEAVRQGVRQWQALPPEARRLLRERFDAWEQLDPGTRHTALAAAAQFDALPETVRQGWRERFARMHPGQQRIYLFDPETREAMALAKELFPFIPATEYEATLAMLRSLDAAAVGGLRQRLDKMSPGQRQALRQRLLALPPEARAAALRES